MDPPRKGSNRTRLLIAVAFCIFWGVYLWFFGPRPHAARLEDSGGGRVESYDWALFELDDKPASFARFRGQPVFLNIWATWCGPCVQEMPSIARLADDPRLKGKDVAFVCVSIDDESVKVRRFLEGRHWRMSFFRAEKIPPVFFTESIPATYIIAPDGRIAASEIGSARWDTPEVVELLEKLAAETPKAP
jgi:thiol-disulfide isomerase/thioredoxin